ncbi:MAG: Rieske 2Fe-2S domain-containing protein [Crocinitomicaceae bacterium]|nr:Rieske 2Fe-2S domain-containing protein [Crocinitomicaceae bacterium]MBT5403315.1 Rieske 2Fe-2S domain-containing protein [Crocinitomicaceae bacterium]MBT6514459.1 Rieske 2Fe-2S domain-containing protein [Crocinitomicaceae bacterium]
MKIKKLHTVLIAISIILSFNTCKKQQQSIPYVNVDIYINISNPAYFHLTSIGGWDYVAGGSRGLIVYRELDNTFNAYDRHCTYNAENACGTAEVDSTGLQIACDCDGSIYQLYDGSIIQGPATLPLHQYRTDFNGSVLHIYN